MVEKQSAEFSGAALVVEDDALIALNISDMLAGLGFDPVDVALTADQAAAFVERGRYAVAVMDIKLNQGDSFGLARRLRERGAPFVFASGYSLKLPPHLADAPFIYKPFSEQALANAIRSLRPGAQA